MLRHPNEKVDVITYFNTITLMAILTWHGTQSTVQAKTSMPFVKAKYRIQFVLLNYASKKVAYQISQLL